LWNSLHFVCIHERFQNPSCANLCLPSLTVLIS
jgi:hypothetical protein